MTVVTKPNWEKLDIKTLEEYSYILGLAGYYLKGLSAEQKVAAQKTLIEINKVLTEYYYDEGTRIIRDTAAGAPLKFMPEVGVSELRYISHALFDNYIPLRKTYPELYEKASILSEQLSLLMEQKKKESKESAP
ncbi:MAG: hypothetical protein LBI01_04960 [Elusimicrobium sp.]|nr:hypothetical protein [Elusimicrobium sp.]